jgi:hypothetical protein
MPDNFVKGIKKSQFNSATSVDSDGYFDFVLNGQNLRIKYTDFLSALNVTGSIVQGGDPVGAPVLDVQGAVNVIRNLTGGTGIDISVNPQNGLDISTSFPFNNFTFDETGIPVVDDPSSSSPIFRSFSSGDGLSIQENINNLIFSVNTQDFSPDNTVVVNKISDLPAPSGGEIQTDPNVTYQIGANITLSDSIRIAPNAMFRSNNFFGPVLKTTSPAGLFVGGDGSFRLNELQISAPNGPLFTFTDTVPLTSTILVQDFWCFEYKEIGTFTDVFGTSFSNGMFFDPVNSTDGITYVGANLFAASFLNMTIQTGSSSFKAVDLGSTKTSIFTASGFNVGGVPGTIGIEGLSNNGNINADSIASIENSNLNGGGATPLVGISSDDYRWRFSGNAGISDTDPCAMASLAGNTTETIISAVNTPVKVEGLFVVQRQSHFSVDTTGKVTYEGERDLSSPVDVSLSLEPVSGSNKNVSSYIALNGTVISDTVRTSVVSAGDPKDLVLTWQLTLSELDELDIFVENNTDAINLIVKDSVFRVC